MNFSLSDAKQILERTPVVLDQLLRGLPDDWILHNEGGDTWSPFDVVGHLIHGEKDDWIPRAKIILSDEEDQTFPPFDRFAMFEESKGKTINQLLDEFRIARQKSLKVLEKLDITDEQWEFKGIHPVHGKVTLRELISTWVTQDLIHIAQITRVMAKQYKENVGSWIKDLRALTR